MLFDVKRQKIHVEMCNFVARHEKTCLLTCLNDTFTVFLCVFLRVAIKLMLIDVFRCIFMLKIVFSCRVTRKLAY